MKVIILCGGKGTRLREETEYKPKPMVTIGNRPIIWHIMNRYAAYGYKEFILPLGYKGDVIRDFFYHYMVRNSDFTVDLKTGDVETYRNGGEKDWKVTLVDTGTNTLKGGRIKRISRYIDTDRFMVTYGDGLADIDIRALTSFHQKTGKIGTFTGVRMPSRFGAVSTDGAGIIRSWKEKPILNEYINGGFFVFERSFLDYLSEDEHCELEKEPLERLAEQSQLAMFPHDGFWACMDTYRDFVYLNDIWNSGDVPWAK